MIRMATAGKASAKTVVNGMRQPSQMSATSLPWVCRYALLAASYCHPDGSTRCGCDSSTALTTTSAAHGACRR
ncbi:hypothetical protein BU204_27170 [Actinophytocola xanthii]|uniref:Uncharacterized protein n=1 Tax=Actinophytocola xanthii TaxID=1912961 RepID=A0A1Q8CGN6_9PSEU|nr:hypothetical protein BU204_27170 [Actinophytocola xanthii]